MPLPATQSKKNKAIKRLAESACESRGYNPFEELIDIAQETEEIQIKGRILKVHKASRTERIAIAKELATYMQPKIKSTESGEKASPTFNIVVQNFSGEDSENTKKAVPINPAKVEIERQ